MELVIGIVALCVVVGGFAAFAVRGLVTLPDLSRAAKPLSDFKRFTPKNTLFIIGPTVNHNACKMQRRLLKPALAALIREDITIIEVYGDAPPRRNGEKIDWLDANLLRHAMNADDGFWVIYVDEEGRTVLRSEAPLLSSDILEEAGLALDRKRTGRKGKTSDVLKKLRAA